MKKIMTILILSAMIALSGCNDMFFEQYEEDYAGAVSSGTEPEQKTTSALPEQEEPATETSVSATEPCSEEIAGTDEIFIDYDEDIYVEYHFRTSNQLDQHFEKHGDEFDSGFSYETAEEYEAGANSVINNPDALYKTEEDDGDGVYYLEDTNEFVILSTDGYIRTYFRPSAGIDYFNRQ